MQQSLFGHQTPSFDGSFRNARRIELREGAWLEHVTDWLDGHARLFATLRDSVSWETHRRMMYDRMVDVPRLLGRPPEHGAASEVLRRAGAALSSRYAIAFESVTVAYYRDGRDSVAMHGDKMGSLVDDTVIAIVSLGEPRRFLIRPTSGGATQAFSLGWGDLLVMGGTCQRTHQHGVPKAANAGPRMSVMFRPLVPEGEERAVRWRPTRSRRVQAA